MDFMSDETFDGRRIRLLTLVDHFTRESLAIEVDGSLGGQRVVDVLTRLALGGRKPKTLSMDNCPEFTSKRLDQWAYLNGVEMDFSRPGKPTDNAMIEAFNARLRAECLNESWFLSLEDARGENRGVAPALQRRTSPQCPGQPRPGDLCPSGHSRGSMTHETNTPAGAKNGARPLSSRSQKMSRLALSRFTRSS